ncbi:MAG: serine/threonine protein kinase [Planctomyces sp.]|nr:serine/threonine protein kinase [Planctomyces sp.]
MLGGLIAVFEREVGCIARGKDSSLTDTNAIECSGGDPEPNENSDTDFVLQGLPEPLDETGLRSREPFEILATQFSEELRQGLGPSIELYARRYPPHADRIREIFPVLAMLEQARTEKESAAFRHNMPDRFPFNSIGGCELLCELGRGGMGIVFQARDERSGHIVAVKVLPWRVSIAPEWKQRFENEAKIAARLRHRNIVPVFRYGIDHGYCYCVMQFVDGVGLDEIIQRLQQSDGVVYQDEILRTQKGRPSGFVRTDEQRQVLEDVRLVSGDCDPAKRRRLTKDSWNSLARIALQIAQAVRAAHAEGVVHNDIKPANILLDGEGRVWVTDFGLSQWNPQAGHGSLLYRIPSGNPAAGQNELPRRLAGTLRYMAPERLLGNSDVRSDLYSAGMTLYELTVLRPAFPETNSEMLIRAILETEPPAPRSIIPGMPVDLETVILNCIAKAPADRYQTADAFLADLLVFGNGGHVSSVRRKSFSGLFKTISDRVRGRKEELDRGQEST